MIVRLLGAWIALAALGTAWAQDEEFDLEDEPASPIAVPVITTLDGDEDDPFEFDMAPEPPPPPPPSPLPDVGDRAPLAGGFPLKVRPAGDAVLVELPVLVALDRPATATTIVGEFLVAGAKAATVQVTVEPTGHRAGAPTFAYLEALLPVAGATGELTVVVKTVAGKVVTERFRETTTFTLP